MPHVLDHHFRRPSAGPASGRDVAGEEGERERRPRRLRLPLPADGPHDRPVTDALTDLAPAEPPVRFYTTVADTPREQVGFDGGYWAANLRRPVRFRQAVAAALEDGHRLVIECTPRPLAVRAIQDTAGQAALADTVVLGLLRRDERDPQAFLTQVGAAHCAGAAVDFAARYPGRLVDVPTSTWPRALHRFDPPYELVAPALPGARQHSLLGGHVHDPEPVVTTRTEPGRGEEARVEVTSQTDQDHIVHAQAALATACPPPRPPARSGHRLLGDHHDGGPVRLLPRPAPSGARSRLPWSGTHPHSPR
ncbi:acyltransferase domain-containing protein [Streptomyces roseoverticillatus]|uniref:acyltransferase domain-containing protein n=1 Tax=Streptomyces roseoverticillatus TaxID=66429 RepID=UPI0033E6F1CF